MESVDEMFEAAWDERNPYDEYGFTTSREFGYNGKVIKVTHMLGRFGYQLYDSEKLKSWRYCQDKEIEETLFHAIKEIENKKNLMKKGFNIHIKLQ